jgi:exodeoxyribonuclease V alpha subunit
LLPKRRSRVVTRELLYTAVTRARERVAIASSAEVLKAAIATSTVRHGGLLSRLSEAAATAN